MIDYKPVSSGLDISRRIADCLEADAPQAYASSERPQVIRKLNGILQGRSERTVADLLAELEKCGDARLPAVLEDIRAFLRQKELLAQPYDKRPSRRLFAFKRLTSPEGRKLKIIDQQLYDRAAREGFPKEFFRESYFDHVTFYCLPDFADFLGSTLVNCKFAVCRIKSVSFVFASIYSTEFYSSVLNYADLCSSTLAHTHFHDCELSYVLLQKAMMKNCDTIDCTVDNADYAGAVLDGCSFGRITAGTIRLDYATITQSGATEEAYRQNREAIYKALGIKEAAA